MAKKKKARYVPSPADKTKHKDGWSMAAPGFAEDSDGHAIGKCPAGFSLDTAQALLDDGIPLAGRYRRGAFPERIYNIHEGVPYHAHQKQPGTYHGFPERPSSIHPSIREELVARAKAQGYFDAYEKWRQEVDGDD